MSGLNNNTVDNFARIVAGLGLFVSLIVTTWTISNDVADRREKALPLFVSETAFSKILSVKQRKEEVVAISTLAYAFRYDKQEAEQEGKPTFFRFEIGESAELKLSILLTHYVGLISRAFPEKLNKSQYVRSKRQVHNRRSIKIPFIFRTKFIHSSDVEDNSALYFLRAEVTWESPEKFTNIKIVPRGFGLDRYLYGKESKAESAVLVRSIWKGEFSKFAESLNIEVEQ